MNLQSVYVIVDGEGNYISPREADDDWHYIKYSGDTTGFVFYDNIKTAEKEKDILNNQGAKFFIEQVVFNTIPKGLRIDPLIDS